MKAEIVRQEEFEGVMLSVIEQDGQEWFLAEDLGKCMGFADPRNGVLKIYGRNKDEFEGNSRAVSLTAREKSGRLRANRFRVFNAKAAVIVAMKAGTPRAKKFRRWVSIFLTDDLQKLKAHILKLEGENRRLIGRQKALPEPESHRQKRFKDLEEELRQIKKASLELLDGKSRTIEKLNRQLDKAALSEVMRTELKRHLLIGIEHITGLQGAMMRLHKELDKTL